MKIAFISTYPPRKCGIGTFTNNLAIAVSGNLKNPVEESSQIVALEEDNQEREYRQEVKYIVRSNHQKDYVQAARFINFSGANVCVLQHEFGIFGGDQGVYILPLINRLRVPLVVTFHTVLKNPSYTQKAIVREIGTTASKIVVMSHLAVKFLRDIYGIPQSKIQMIEHGVPDFDVSVQAKLKEKYGFKERKILFTFGLIGRNKGIETTLHALPRVVKHHPDLLYIILGKTHPAVLKISGEEYREHLKMLVNNYNLQNNVFFYNQFVSEAELMEYLQMADLYVTPYLAEEQITSGTLSYAVGAGSCVLSTPYWHAKELLDKGRGILFGFRDHGKLSRVLLDLLDHPEKIRSHRKKAFDYGKKLRWPKVGNQYLQLYKKLSKVTELPGPPRNDTIDITVMPNLKPDHIYRLTDETGIIKHARYGIPRLKAGYCLRDNAMALIMSIMYFNQRKEWQLMEYIPRYLSFIEYMQNSDGTFRNQLTFNRNFRDMFGTEESFSRTVWALGYLVHHKPADGFKQTGKEIFLRSVPHFDRLQSLRGIAKTVIGLSLYLQEFSEQEELTQLLIRLVSRLMESFDANAEKGWQWFEKKMTYDNGILPLALLYSYTVVENEQVLKAGRKSLDFLTKILFQEDYFSPVGNRGWLTKDSEIPVYNLKSTEAMGMILLYHQAFRLFKDRKHLLNLFNCYLWYLGENRLNIPLYDHESGGCYDGLNYKGVNKNEGAESTLAFLIAHLTVLKAHGEEHFRI